VQELAEIDDVLFPQRLVEAEVLQQRRARRLGEGRRQEVQRWIARHQPEQQERQAGHHPQHQQEMTDPFSDQARHAG
jgi:hypothetical protein